MALKKSNKDRYNFLIDKNVYEDFSMLCDELGLVRSKQVEIFMKKFVEDKKSALKEAQR